MYTHVQQIWQTKSSPILLIYRKWPKSKGNGDEVSTNCSLHLYCRTVEETVEEIKHVDFVVQCDLLDIMQFIIGVKLFFVLYFLQPLQNKKKKGFAPLTAISVWHSAVWFSGMLARGVGYILIQGAQYGGLNTLMLHCSFLEYTARSRWSNQDNTVI